MKKKPRMQDMAFMSVAVLAVVACIYFPVPTWMLIFSIMVLVVVLIGVLGNLGLFERQP
ncbi:MAG: hypothetical protein HKN59_10205 [Gammaproteobacteria bacterium]|nr:hypothetical protein [Gammaproteobacteria bacterium]